MCNKWYKSSGYRWVSISLAMGCVATILAFGIIDLITRRCNDSYHNINNCLNSTSCDVRYCEPSSCEGYTCLPKLSSECIEDDMIYFMEGKCPMKKKYKTSIIIIGLSSALFINLLIFFTTIIYDKCSQTYAELYLDDEVTDRIIKNTNGSIIKCSNCMGMTDGCIHCNGTGFMNGDQSQSDFEDFY